jgi:hypothetical protein
VAGDEGGAHDGAEAGLTRFLTAEAGLRKRDGGSGTAEVVTAEALTAEALTAEALTAEALTAEAGLRKRDCGSG